MAGLDIFGLHLPSYVVITLFFSYLIWTKFLNEGKLSFSESDSILEIVSIFFVLFPTIISLCLVFGFIPDHFAMQTNLEQLWNNTKLGVVFLIIILLYLLALHYAKKPQKRENFLNLLKGMLGLQCIFILILIAILIAIYNNHFEHLRSSVLIGLFIFTVILMTSCYLSKKVFQLKLINSKLFEPFILVLIATLILAFILSVVLTKTATSVETTEYTLDLDEKQVAYAHTKVPININLLKNFKSYIYQIPIKYGELGFDTEGFGGENFRILINTSKDKDLQVLMKNWEDVERYVKNPYPKKGFTSARINKQNKIISLKFDQVKIREEEVTQIVVQGIVRKDIEELRYKYSDNSEEKDVCNAKGCLLKMSITNPMKKHVNHLAKEFVILSNRDLNVANCQFIGINFNHDLKNVRNYDRMCEGDSCSFEVRENGTRKIIMNTHFYFKNKKIMQGKSTFRKPMNVSLEVNVKC